MYKIFHKHLLRVTSPINLSTQSVRDTSPIDLSTQSVRVTSPIDLSTQSVTSIHHVQC
jgi:hypothetical protein